MSDGLTPERRPRRSRRRVGLSAGLALGALALSVILPAWLHEGVRRPNMVVIVTDDQSADSIPNPALVMPFLQRSALDPGDQWIVFPNGFVNTPLCCPSRATMLTGRFAHHTGVQANEDAERLDESSTLATWLHGAGYHTGLVGKYLNRYPFGDPYVPAGWDRWWGRLQGPPSSLYYDYALYERDHIVRYGHAPSEYATDVLAAKATEFIREAPTDRPFFLWFAPTAPHPPWIAAPRDQASSPAFPVPTAPSVGEADVSDKPAWVRGLPPFDNGELEEQRANRRRSYAALLAVDDAIRDIMGAVDARGASDDTVVVFTSDNGLAFGEHRWTRKSCPYEACLRVPLMIRMPGVEHRKEPAIVSAADLAPTIADLAGVSPVGQLDGTSLVPLLSTGNRVGRPGQLFAESVGDETVPGWWEIRTGRFAYIELATGERELYALRDDPHELVNVAEVPGFEAAIARLSGSLDDLRNA